jgi:hypothetical protein
MNEGWFWMLPSKHAKIDEDGQKKTRRSSITLARFH